MIKLAIFDFDGVFTNGDIYIDENNLILKKYNVKDGMGIKNLKNENINIGIISGFKENKSQLNIIEHLGIEYFSLGKKNKLDVIKRWCKKLNIDIDKQVSYMGDDINDLEVLNSVILSGCPNDAIKEVVNVVDFISKKNGGEGSVRDFCDYILNYNKNIMLNTNSLKINNDNIIQQIKEESQYQLDNINIDEISNLSSIILDKNKNNNIFFIGVGKSGNIADHTSFILKSLNIKSFSLNSLNLAHGDLGSIKKNDLIICYSRSGNTKELIEVLPFIKNKETYIVGICCNEKSKFKNICHKTIVLPFKNEILNFNNINSIPTNSYMVFLYFTNILAYELIKNSKLNIEKYKLNHPAGNIGKQLMKIKDILIANFPKLILEEKMDVNKVFLEMTKLKIGCCFFVNKEDELLGILTDGDIRRLLIKKKSLNKITEKEINTNFYYETDLNKYIKDCKKIGYIPVINNKKLIGIINN